MAYPKLKKIEIQMSRHEKRYISEEMSPRSDVAFAKFYKKNPKGTNVGHAFLYIIKMV